MSQHEESLVAGIRANDSTALASFLDLKRPQLLAFIHKNLSDALRRKVEAEDILQEVSISCVGALGDVNLSEREPFSWLCQVAERRIIDAHRRHFDAQKRAANREVAMDARVTASRQTPLVDLLAASMTSPSKAFSRDQREFQLQQAVLEMPDEIQTALRLRYVDGLPTKVIAEQLGKSDAAIRVLLSRSVKKLEQLLSPPE